MGNAVHTFAPRGLDITGACAMAATAVLLFIGRGGGTPAGFSERSKQKYHASMLSQLALGVFYLCVSLGNHTFGHNFVGGHWIPDGMWIAFGVANVATVYATSMAFAQVESYAWVTTILQAIGSTFLYIGARSSTVFGVQLSMCIMAFFFALAQGYYFVRWCTPSKEWQQSHGGGLYTWYRLIFTLIMHLYPAFWTMDVTFRNIFHDKELHPWIAYLIINFVVHAVNIVLVNFVFNTEPMPPFGIWNSWMSSNSDVAADGTSSTGLMSRGVLDQQLQPNPAASSEVPETQEGRSGIYGGFNYAN
jgi:hypothetical protein